MLANGVMPGEEDLGFGCSVTVRTTTGEEISGTIFTFDRVTNLLVISEDGSRPGSVSYRFLKADFIKEIVAVSRPSEMSENPLEFVRLDDCVRREEDAVRAIEIRHAPRVEVIEAGQKLMSKLSAEYACKWEGKTITIEDKVFVDEPYSIADFRSADEHSDLREILRLMVDEEN